MAEDIIQIIKIDTSPASLSIKDLRNNIKLLKESLDEKNIGTPEYKAALKELQLNQNALKDAMYATSASMDQVVESAKGAGTSYNSLVHRMAELKQELRATDVSTESGKNKFKELAAEVNNVNDKLKDMDALQGNFQRNVGNYPGLMKNFAGAMDSLDKGLKVTQGGVMGLKGGFDALAANPIITIVGVLLNIFSQLAGKIKENESATEALKRGMDALQPVFDMVAKVIEKLAGWVAKVIDYIVDLADKNKDTFKNMIAAVVGVGNAILQVLLLPIKNTIAAVKGLGDAFKHLFKGEFKEAAASAKETFSQIGDQFKSAFDFKGNFAKGKEVGEQFAAGLGSTKKKVSETAKSVGKEAKDSLLDGLKDISDDIDKLMDAEMAAWEKAQEEALKSAKASEERRLQAMDKATKQVLELNDIMVEDEREKAEKQYAIQEAANQKRLQALQQFAKDALERGDLDAYLEYEQQAADLEVEIQNNALKEKKRLRELDNQDAKEKAKQQMEIMQSVASATSGILSSIADMYENDSENAEKNAKKIKTLRISAATIDTISGAIGAFTQAAETIPPPAGIIVGAIQAAAVTAAGLAQIAQIKNTEVSASESGSASGNISAISAAPTLTTEVANVRSVTSASEEERLNQMASEQRVYILSSDIEASQKAIKTQVAEASF